MLKSEIDYDTKCWAEKITFKDFLGYDPGTPSPQYNGDDFPEFCLRPSPNNIISCFKDDDCFLQGFILAIFWGSMWQKNSLKRIFCPRLTNVESTLKEAKEKIVEEESIKNAWKLLAEQLYWSPVFISKVLHFLSRSAGFEQNPPVPMDNKVTLKQIWPKFLTMVRQKRENGNNNQEPAPWEGKFEGYSRYMTLINVWAKEKNWSTTNIETTLFKKYNVN